MIELILGLEEEIVISWSPCQREKATTAENFMWREIFLREGKKYETVT